MLLACHAGIALGAMSIPTYTIGAFVVPLRQEFGWSAPQVQAAILVSQVMCGCGAVLAGVMIDRIGIRRLALTGSVGVSLSLLFAAINPGSLPLFWLAFALLALLGCGSGPIPWTRAITGRFVRQRGAALAIALSGTGLSGIFLPPLVVMINQDFGWRSGFLFLSALPLFIAVPLTYAFFRSAAGRGDQPAEPASLREPVRLRGAMRSHRFWVLLVSVLLIYLGITGIVPNLIPTLVAKGFAPGTAAVVQSSYAAALIVGRLVLGWLVDRFWAPGVAALVLTPAAAGCMMLTGDIGLTATLIAVAAIGLAAGAELDLLAYLTARYFGVLGLPRIYASLYFAVTIAAGFGPLAFAWLAERTGSADVGLIVAGAMFLVGGPIMLTLGGYPDDIDGVAENRT